MKLSVKLFFISLVTVTSFSAVVSCSKTPGSNEQPSSSRFITGVMIPINTELTPNGEYVIKGTGFVQGDKIFFEEGDKKIEATVAAATGSSMTIIVPALLEDGKQYKIVIYRGTNSQTLGTTRVSLKVISNVVIPAEIRAACGDEITILGSGFATGDKIVFAQNIEAVAVTKGVSVTGITIIIPQEVDNGLTTIKLRRAGTDYRLGESTLILTISLTVADKPSMTIKGMVYLGGRPLSGVSVSDGDEITQTDANGHYWINSAKRNKLVFVILPSGFEAKVKDAMPQFWAPCTQAAGAMEQINFALSPKDNDKHTTLVFTDAHLANRNTPLDYLQFRDGFLAEMKSTYNSANNVIGLNLGDISWDLYWYDRTFALPEAKKEYASLNFPVFMAMGNHDNDPHVSGDFNGEVAWRQYIGPAYYSMNIGKIHYLMLDNVVWINTTAGPPTSNATRNYSTGIDANQLAWLKKDLALVDAATPVIVGFHIPTISYSTVTGGKYVSGSVVSGMSAVMTELRKFNTVHILTGHSHNSRNITIDYQQGAYERREHNITGTSATWWWTNQYTSNKINVAPDGTPAGYKIFDIDGKNITWRYKAVGQPANRQFVAFDMNKVKEYWTTNTNALQAFTHSDFASRANDYSSIGANEVLINVWAFEQDFWKISVKEGATELPVDAVWLNCPLHTISYDIPRRASGNTLTFPSDISFHTYRVKAVSATSTLEITVEDRFGNIYKNTMTRPKLLTTAIE